MLINESGLVRCIKRAYKSAGYAVAAEGDCMTIYTEQWLSLIHISEPTRH